jgi:signal transduction histidine kinase
MRLPLPRALLARIANQFVVIMRTPFQSNPNTLTMYTLDELQRQRSGALLRLMILCINVMLVLVILPIILLSPVPPNVAVGVIINILVGFGCLALIYYDYPYLAAGIYLMGFIVGFSLSIVFQDVSGLSFLSLLAYGYFVLGILIAGLALPPWGLGLTALGTMVATLATLWLAPLAPSLIAAGGSASQVRGIASGIFLSLEGVVTLLSWLAAQSVHANMQTSLQALLRERELIRLKDEFIIDANHELRTPIMALFGNVEVLARLGDRATPEQRDRFIQRALAAGRTTLRLLGSVLDASVVQGGTVILNPEPIVVRDLVSNLVETFDPREIGEPDLSATEAESLAQRVTVAIDPGLTMTVDPIRLRQILSNLLSNALKYSAAATPISIRAALEAPRKTTKTLPQPPQWVTFSVQDQGLGIPLADADKLFQRFVRLERDIAGPVRGSGVGLYLCRVLVQAMGGTIGVQSSGEAGEGATFHFRLPLGTR